MLNFATVKILLILCIVGGAVSSAANNRCHHVAGVSRAQFQGLINDPEKVSVTIPCATNSFFISMYFRLDSNRNGKGFNMLLSGSDYAIHSYQ